MSNANSQSDFTSMLENGNKIPFLKKDAIVPIEIGTGFLQQIAAVIPILLENKSQADVTKIEQLIKDKQSLEPWMSGVASIQILVKTVFEKAYEMGLVEFKNTDETLKEEMFKPEN